MTEDICLLHASVPMCLGCPINEPEQCAECGGEICKTGSFRTHQIVLYIDAYEDGVEFSYGVLCTGCQSVPFMYTIPVMPTRSLREIDDMIISGFSGKKSIMDALLTLHETGKDVDIARAFLTDEGACVFCFDKGSKEVEWCEKCARVPLCKDRCPGFHLHRFACAKIQEWGGVFDLDNLAIWVDDLAPLPPP